MLITSNRSVAEWAPPTPSFTSSITLTASSLPVKACENAAPTPSPLTSSQNADSITASAGAGCSRSFEFSAHDRAKSLLTISEICKQEAAEFANYLASRSAPCKAVLKRLAHEDYAAMEERLVDAMGDEISRTA